MADENRRRRILSPQPVGSSDEIRDIGTEVRIFEFTLAASEAGEIESKQCNALLDQSPANMRRCATVLRAGETVGKKRECARPPIGKVESRGQGHAEASGKLDPEVWHRRLLIRCCLQ